MEGNEENIDTDIVSIGSRVTVKDVEDDVEEEYLIVGSTEADPMSGKISDESPVGKALLGKKVGEVAEAILPGGDTAKFKVLSIG